MKDLTNCHKYPPSRQYFSECNKCFGTGCTCGGIGYECICNGCDCYKVKCFTCDHKLRIDYKNNKVWCELYNSYLRNYDCVKWLQEDNIYLEKYYKKILAFIQITFNAIWRKIKC